jgi:hypothetical protein
VALQWSLLSAVLVHAAQSRQGRLDIARLAPLGAVRSFRNAAAQEGDNKGNAATAMTTLVTARIVRHLLWRLTALGQRFSAAGVGRKNSATTTMTIDPCLLAPFQKTVANVIRLAYRESDVELLRAAVAAAISAPRSTPLNATEEYTKTASSNKTSAAYINHGACYALRQICGELFRYPCSPRKLRRLENTKLSYLEALLEVFSACMGRAEAEGGAFLRVSFRNRNELAMVEERLVRWCHGAGPLLADRTPPTTAALSAAALATFVYHAHQAALRKAVCSPPRSVTTSSGGVRQVEVKVGVGVSGPAATKHTSDSKTNALVDVVDVTSDDDDTIDVEIIATDEDNTDPIIAVDDDDEEEEDDMPPIPRYDAVLGCIAAARDSLVYQGGANHAKDGCFSRASLRILGMLESGNNNHQHYLPGPPTSNSITAAEEHKERERAFSLGEAAEERCERLITQCIATFVTFRLCLGPQTATQEPYLVRTQMKPLSSSCHKKRR